MNRQSHPTLIWIQALRALAAITIVVAHTNAETGWFAVYLNKPSGLPGMGTGAAGVDLFFVISGFVMVYASEPLFGSTEGARQFLLRRIIRIVPLYWISTVAMLLVYHHYSSWSQEGINGANAIASFAFVAWPRLTTMNPILGVGWSLNFEMFFYLCFAIAMIAQARTAIIGMTLFLFTFGQFGNLLPLPTPLAYLGDQTLWPFACGLLISFAFREGVRAPQWVAWTAMAVGLIALAVAANYDKPPDPFHRFLTWGFPCVLIVGGAVLVPNPSSSSRFWRLMTFLGDASYAMYLTHGITMTVFRMQFLGLGTWLYEQQPVLYASVIALISIGLGCLLHAVIEKPLTDTLKARLPRRKTTQTSSEVLVNS